MTQDERRIWLINYLLKERDMHKSHELPHGRDEQRQLLRSLMNIRMPMLVSEEFILIQDQYLRERNIERGIVYADDLEPVSSDKSIYIRQGDITTLACNAVVNACNSRMLGCFQPMHSCIDNFIHTYAGVELRLKMNDIMKAQGHDEPTGHAKITPGYNLPAKYIIHTVGPVVYGGLTRENEEELASCYTSCLNIAAENGVESIAFCCISTGVFMFPQDKAAEIAVSTVKKWRDKHSDSCIKKIIFNVFKDIDLNIYKNILG